MAARAGVKVELSVSGPERALPTAVELAAHRIVQESLTNVVRHAEAASATVALRYGVDSLVVLVEDDGRGREAAPDGDGHGLVGMRERAAAVGGTLDTGPAAGGGFRVIAQLPLPGATG
jgi:signal transduction histidine kinase